MISHFFIDRPIFATVLSTVITLTGAIAYVNLPVAQYPQITPPSIQVSISYPGASAQIVADTVGAPIEQQVNGVENMLYMSSQSGNDGSYSLSVTFDVGTNLNTALVMVQNRVMLAMPLLPSEVQNQGISIRKRTPDILMIISLYSPDHRYDDLYLSNYAMINCRDEVLRVDGVSDCSIFGERDYSIRAWLDPQKMAALGINAGDVADAIRNQNLDVPAGQLGAPPAPGSQSREIPIDALGRLSEPEQFKDIIIKVGRTSSVPMSTVAMLPMQNTVAAVAQATANSLPTAASMGGATNSSLGMTAIAALVRGVSGTSAPASTVAGMTSSSGTGSAGGSGGAAAAAPTISSGTTPALDSSSIVSDTGGAAASSGPASLVLPSRPSAGVVRLRDIARVEMGALNYNQAQAFDGNQSVGIAVFQLPGTNALDVANRAKLKMAELKKRFPPGIEYQIAYDTTLFISESIADVYKTLFESVALVALVVLVFLQDWRGVLIPMISVPVAIIGTFAAMAVVGFSLNNISLFGLVLAVCIVVDDAIVVVENVDRWLEHGLPPREAARKAMTEVTGPIIAIALVLCAVFVPCAFISGITGRFFKQFAVTIAVSTIFSAINSLTLSPALAAILLRRKRNGGALVPMVGGMAPEGGATSGSARADGWRNAPEGGTTSAGGLDALRGWWSLLWSPMSLATGLFCRAFNAAFRRTTGAYAWSVGKLLRVNVLVLLLYVVLLVMTIEVFSRAPRGFVPQQDQGRIIAGIQLPDATSLNRTEDLLAEAAKVAQGDPDDPEHYPGVPGVAHTITTAGSSFVVGAAGPNLGSMFITLTPFNERRRPELNDMRIMDRLSEAWAKQIPDAQIVAYGAAPVPGLSVAGGFRLIVEDPSGLGLPVLEEQTNALVKKLQTAPGLTRVTTQFRSNAPQLFMDIDRPKTAALGVPFSDVNQTLAIYLGSLYVNSFNAFGRHWQVTIQAEGDYRQQVSDINLLEVRNSQQQMVPLGTLVNVQPQGGPLFVYRYNGHTATSTTGSLKPGASSGEVIKEVEQTAHETLLRTMNNEWTELMFMQIRDGDTTLQVFSLAVMCVFLALSALYESWSLPLAVILVVPLCLLCSITGVLASHGVVDIFVQIGLVVLVALACKNSILIVEFARDLHAGGRPRHEATVEASRLRLRPILMTSFSFILGVVPLVIATGAGAEMRRSLGMAVFSGMIGVTLFGIFLTPVFFYVITGIGELSMFSTPRMRRLGFAVVVLLNIVLLGLPALLLMLLGRTIRRPAPGAAPFDDTAGPEDEP
jgi:multidrug efflux pump